jgi:hypothetical protein
MSILITGMKMPKRGMVVNIYADGRVTNHFDEFGKTIGKAVPVPPHGRLIDADVLIRDNGIKEIPEYYEVVRDAPTIIPASEEG